MDRSFRQKVNQERVALNETLNQMELINLYRTFHPNAAKYTFFLSAHRTFLRIDHILEHKTNLSVLSTLKSHQASFLIGMV